MRNDFHDEIEEEERLEILGAKRTLELEILELEKRPFDDEDGIDPDVIEDN